MTPRVRWDVRLPRKIISSWVYHQRPDGGRVMHFGGNLKRDLRIELILDGPPVVCPDAVRLSARHPTQSRNQARHVHTIAPRSKAREAKGYEHYTRGATPGTMLGRADGT